MSLQYDCHAIESYEQYQGTQGSAEFLTKREEVKEYINTAIDYIGYIMKVAQDPDDYMAVKSLQGKIQVLGNEMDNLKQMVGY